MAAQPKTKKTLKKVYDNFIKLFDFRPFMAVEVEFYLESSDEDILVKLGNYLLKNKLVIEEVKEEEGRCQLEVTLPATHDIIKLADDVILLRKLIEKFAKSNKLQLSFAAKPYEERPSSGMHVHISLHDGERRNLLQRDGEDEASLMLHAIAGLLENMLASVKYMAPYEEAYIRFTPSKSTATKVSWGGNNRTVAIRIPASSRLEHFRRIEYRLPTSDSDPYIVFAALLLGVQYGVENSLEIQYPKIYGDAYLDQYDLPSLPKSLKEALAIQSSYIDDVLQATENQ